MKHLPLLTATLCGFLPAAKAQRTLQPGDSYIISFSTLPEISTGAFGDSPSGGFQFHLTDFEYGTDVLSFFLFEETAAELSVAGGVAEASVDSTALEYAFADFDGGVLFTMIAGSVTIEDITFWFQEPIDLSDSRRHSLTIIPAQVPEPGAALLATLGTLVVFLGNGSRRTPKRSGWV